MHGSRKHEQGYCEKETTWISVALMEMSMEISACSLMCSQQSKGKYKGNVHVLTVGQTPNILKEKGKKREKKIYWWTYQLPTYSF